LKISVIASAGAVHARRQAVVALQRKNPALKSIIAPTSTKKGLTLVARIINEKFGILNKKYADKQDSPDEARRW
jgi:hypothetical protein